jgi:hypothetical protein
MKREKKIIIITSPQNKKKPETKSIFLSWLFCVRLELSCRERETKLFRHFLLLREIKRTSWQPTRAHHHGLRKNKGEPKADQSKLPSNQQNNNNNNNRVSTQWQSPPKYTFEGWQKGTRQTNCARIL